KYNRAVKTIDYDKQSLATPRHIVYSGLRLRPLISPIYIRSLTICDTRILSRRQKKIHMHVVARYVNNYFK
ncbi:MAG: hypothetical protein JXB49_17855, partial [Bacteroidales bacterium]|nr:hypothetical protein [Bacteroidales bacterium]